ncbi:MAG: hypothetical protein L0956_04505 [Candidatus Mariimomonas ferrooxydans]
MVEVVWSIRDNKKDMFISPSPNPSPQGRENKRSTHRKVQRTITCEL